MERNKSHPWEFVRNPQAAFYTAPTDACGTDYDGGMVIGRVTVDGAVVYVSGNETSLYDVANRKWLFLRGEGKLGVLVDAWAGDGGLIFSNGHDLRPSLAIVRARKQRDLTGHEQSPAFYSAPMYAASVAQRTRLEQEFRVALAHTAVRRERHLAIRQQEDMVADGWPDDPAGAG